MPSFYDRIPGYREAVAAETVGRDAAYLRLPLEVAGILVRPLTLEDYLRLSAENSPFVAGGKANKDDACFLLWHQALDLAVGITPQEFALRFDPLAVTELTAVCGALVDRAMADAPSGGGSGKGGFFGIGAMLCHAFRREYPGMSKEEVLETPLDQLWQEFRAIQQSRNPKAILFNRSDRLKGEYLRRRTEELAAQRAKA